MSSMNTSFQSIGDDPMASAPFRASYPLDFNLYDDDDQPVLYIDEQGHNLHLEVANSSRQTLNLSAPANPTPGPENYHFELKFRPGTLAKTSLSIIAMAEPGWTLGKPAQQNAQPGGAVSLYFLSAAARTLNPGDNIKLTLTGVSADGGGGSRGTRVELRFRQMTYPGESTSLNGTRVQHVSIVNQEGKKNIPIHVGFVGSNTILNDGQTPNELTLRITNALKASPIPLTVTGSARSKFVISFDVQDKAATPAKDSKESKTVPQDPQVAAKDWALTDAGQVGAILVQVRFRDQDAWKNVAQAAGQQGESPEWIIENDALERLDPGQHIQIKLSGIKSSLPSGQTNLYVRYENIPGYWDGQFIVVIEKAPLVYRQNRVGIGTVNPQAPLAVRGIDQSEELLSFEDSSGKVKWHVNQNLQGDKPGLNFVETSVADGRLFLKPGGNVGIGTVDPKAKLHVTQGAIMPEQGNSATAGILFPSAPGVGTGDSAWLRYYARSGEAATLEIGVSNDADDHIALMPSGNVGIGTTSPTAKLEVKGSIKSPMWKVTELISNRSGPVPIASPKFRTEGGTLLIFVNGSAYRLNRGVTGIDIKVDGKLKGSATAYNDGLVVAFDQAVPYRMTLCNSMIATNVPAGEHSLTIGPLSAAPETKTDGNDIFNVTVLELPF